MTEQEFKGLLWEALSNADTDLSIYNGRRVINFIVKMAQEKGLLSVPESVVEWDTTNPYGEKIRCSYVNDAKEQCVISVHGPKAMHVFKEPN
jgi:hypothetical protein